MSGAERFDGIENPERPLAFPARSLAGSPFITRPFTRPESAITAHQPAETTLSSPPPIKAFTNRRMVLRGTVNGKPVRVHDHHGWPRRQI